MQGVRLSCDTLAREGHLHEAPPTVVSRVRGTGCRRAHLLNYRVDLSPSFRLHCGQGGPGGEGRGTNMSALVEKRTF